MPVGFQNPSLNKCVRGVSIFTVTSRLLAFALALIISSPTCWCCVPHEVARSEAAHRSCCHSEKTASTTKPAKGHDCPCALSLTKRNVAEGKLSLPKPASWDLMTVPWLIETRLSVPMTAPMMPTRVEVDPPWHALRLYQWHHSLLL